MIAFAAMAALLVALLNLVVAATVLGAARKNRQLMLSALAPAGVGLFSVALCVTLLNPDSVLVLWPVSGGLCLLSVTGFIIEAWTNLLPKDRRWALWGQAGLTTVATCVTLYLRPEFGWLIAVSAGFGASLVAVLAGMAIRLQRHPDPAMQRFSRQLALAVAVGSGLGAVVSICVTWGLKLDVRGLEPIWIVLIAETLFLLQVLNRRLDVQMALSRAVTYTLLLVGIAVVAAFSFRRLGYPADMVQLLATILVALLAALLFIGLGDRISHGVESLLFPGHAKLARQLAASRGEYAALRTRLEQAERLAIAGELAASVAHEIKNPLAALRGYAELLAAGGQHVDPSWRGSFEKAVRIIREEGDRIDTRVAELLQSARTRQAPSRDSTVELNRVVLEAISVMEREPGVRAIHARLDPSVTHAVGLEDEIRGALCNLLKNAAEAQQPHGGEIEVTTRWEQQRVIVEIRDEGVGLEGCRLEQLFQPFHTTKQRGTGLGLPIARSAVEAAGGSLTLAPRTDRRGAIARIELLIGEVHV